LLCLSILLGWFGGLPVIEPYISWTRSLVTIYFLVFFLFFPVSMFIDQLVYHTYVVTKFKSKIKRVNRLNLVNSENRTYRK
jgi:hypothetical protein